MLRSYLIIAIRHLSRHKVYSLINIFCLSIGITFSMIIGLFVLHAFGVNAGLKNIRNQYVIKSIWKQENMGVPVTTLGPLAMTMKNEYPNLVENYFRFDPVTNIVFAGEKHFRTQICVGDTTWISMFGFPLLRGNPNRAFQNNKSAVITEDLAIKLFGNSDVLYKLITIQTPADGGKHDFIVTAVLPRVPLNSVTGFTGAAYQVYLPMDANQYFQGGDKGDNWSNVYMASILQLKQGVSPKDLAAPFEQVLAKYQPTFVKGNLHVQLVGLKDYYLKDNHDAVLRMITTLSLIAIFILLLAIINFVNINIGTSTYRLKEIGLRKVFGGAKFQLIIQYFIEALTITFAATCLSVLWYELLRPLANQLLDTTLDHFWNFGFNKVALVFFLFIGIGFMAGLYPAFVLSSSNIITAVRGKIDAGRGGLLLRKSLLVIQCTLAIVVFICTINVSKQISYFFNIDLGYNKDQVMIVSSLPRQYDSIGVVKMENAKSELMQIPAVQSISLCYDIPDGYSGGNVNIYGHHNGDYISMISMAADADFCRVFGLQFIEGAAPLSEDRNYGQGKIVLNEAALKALGWTTAVRKKVSVGGIQGVEETIVGVVKDFHFESLQKKVQPMIIAGLNEPYTRSYRYLALKLHTADIKSTIRTIQDKCKSLFPEAGFEYGFIDEKYQSLYQTEMQLKQAAYIATIVSFLIVFLGIFGILAFTLAKRTKEIAVRKVLGADIKTIISIFLKEYVVLIVLSDIIAWPLAYTISSRWLDNYAYRIHQNLTPNLMVFGIVLLMAIVLISVQCFKSAIANPVLNLRSE
jgi:putative ABC transport system permease protein